MERKGATHSEDPMYGASSPLASLHVDRGKGIKYEGGDGQRKGNDYEVFLSFRGNDTRKSFTDYLYTSLVDAGIHVFRDDNELRVGEEIGSELAYCIMQSKISIPIISEDYSSSKWCLRELALMLECKRSRGQIVLPIFYKVKPSRLRHLIGRFGDAINAHKRNLGEMVVKEWEEALVEVSSLKGWELEEIGDGLEGKLVKIVVRKVMKELKEFFMLTVPQQLVGIDVRVKEILSLIDFNGTSIIGIYGMGGIGKTTLAKVLYSKLSSHFENLSFVANIRETSRSDGITCLRQQVSTDIIGSDVDQGINVIESGFTHRKVLILLDDIDDSSQLNALCGDGSWFKAGSIVIITTRNKRILDMAGVSYMYELNGLPLDQSLILFSRHAFRKDHPHNDYESISRDIVSITDGLPLTLEVIGSFLHGRRKKVWEDTLKKLKKVPHLKVQERLRISYEALDYKEKQIFLDTACFFVGSSIQSPTYMWESCCFFPEVGIERLSDMSLIKVDKDGKLMMHDQMRDLGRTIVLAENPRNPQERSRLWIHEEAEHVLSNNGGTSKIEALCLYKYSCRSYKSEQFKHLTNLRFLQVHGVNFIGDFQNLLPQLRWLEWQECPSNFVAANFHPKKLVVLNLSWSGISEDWGGWGPLKMAIELRVLNLTHCYSLRRTPDLSTFKRLEILILEDCEKLEEIHSSIGDIKTLVSLNVKRCKRLEELPAGIGRMDDLRELLLDEIAIQEIPVSRGGLMKLETLRVSFCAQFAQLSESVGSLMSLTQLDLSHLGIKELPESIGFLKKLNTLDASYCASLAWIPSSIGYLASLQRLLLRECCSLREIPDSIGQLKSLIELDLKSTTIVELPESICNLQKLRILDIRGTDMTKSPGAIATMAKLPELRCLHIDKSMEKMEVEAIQRAADMETSDRNYAIAAVQNVVGIDDRAKQITDLLEMEVSDEVRIIGIYGTDGIGKTTLAKAVYKRISSCFDRCSFLKEVEETTQNSHDIQLLQKKLILDILERDCDETIEDFLDIFREMKVLIVVDDVEKPSDLHAIVGDHLHWFGPGSRIIVTSKNSGILKEYDIEKARNYMVSELDDSQAFELFCKHAFRMQYSIPDYNGLSNRILNATEKLPLAVEVVGSFLRGKSIQEWEKMEKSMKERLMSSQKTTVGLEEILDICYKELDRQQKKLFLDIVCFTSDLDARIALYLWPNCYLSSSGCVLMPLAKIGENNELQIHRLLRCLGKRIFKQEGSGDPSSGRFCTQDMVLKAMNREGIENVEARDSCILTAAGLASMPDISFLKLDDAKVSGDFAGAFPSLRWLCWQKCPLGFDAINFVLRELVILDLSWSKVTEDWGGWAEIKMEKLKVLNLTGCSDLLITPDFSDYKDLEILILERCSRLVKLHPSIGHLKRLVSLNLKFCSRLHRLPEELGCATALKELFIDGTSVRQIPISIGNLKQLEILSGSKCFPLTHLPSSICYLTALSDFLLEGAKISELPSSLGKLLKLRRLSLRDCRYLEELPYSIGEIWSLEELDISASSISELPDSIRNLKSLRVLRMDSSFIREFPKEIGNLTNLEELHASWCGNLKGAIPSDIEGLCHLRSLMLGHSSISSLPPEISTISGLLTLDLIRCNEIEELPKLPPSLICLRVSSKRMKAIPLLEDLKELEVLCLSDGGPKARGPFSKQPMPESSFKQMIDKPSFTISFPKLRKLELSLSQIIKLKFEPTDVPQLKTLTLSGLSLEEVSELPKTLSVLSIQGCSSLKSLPTVQGLNNLSVFELCHSAIEEIEGLEGLKALKRLDISNCRIQNLNGIDRLTSLRSLILSDCDYLDSLPDLSNLKSLKVLEIRRCKMIHQIEGLEKLTSLERLNISECPAENSVLAQNTIKDVRVRSVKIWGHGHFIEQGVTSLKYNREEIVLDTSNKSMKKMEDELKEQPADVETSDRNYYAIAAVQNVVGIDDCAKQITDLLEMEVNDEVHIIGIYGTVGIGKTTLAKAVYRRISSCFDSCSFLTVVEETTQNSHGIQYLQNKLIHDILERDREDLSFDERIEDFLDIFREMKVLIVVDDVEKPSDLHAVVGNQLDWFGPGSRIIVTSKNSGILEEFDSDKARNYTVSELDDGQAFELFWKHAFRMQSSIPDYDELSNRIVNAIEKLPLAVEVVGSFLRGKSIQEWIKMEKLMKARLMGSQRTTVGLQELLDICYKELDQQQKDIFLDIACFISGVDARIASYTWPNCYPSSGCILMPLAKIGENNELQMHRLLRCRGKDMFEQEIPRDPSGRKFYIQEKGKENFEALPIDFTAQNLQMMRKLRFLKLDNAKVSGKFKGAYASLRWLCWQRCPLDFSVENFVLTELVILDLSWSKLTEDRGGWSDIKMEKLKVLNLTGCSDLLLTPDFSGYKNLEILILERCSHLVKLDPSIGNLKRLVSLNLKFCSQLNGLPVELGCTTALKELFIDGTSVRQIPISLGNLKQLKILSGLKCFPLTYLPSSICSLIALSELSLEGAQISELPSLLGELLKLRRLSLRDCLCLEKLPYSIGEMGSLEELDISATSISELPDSIRNLKSLRVLRMDSSFIRALPGEIGNLTKLEELHASWCPSLEGPIPRDIKGLHSLRSLTLGHSSISNLPPELSTISGLHTLDLIQCNEIEELPKLPPSLNCLRVSSKRMKGIPLLEDMKELEELCLSDGDLKACQPPSKLPMPESNVKRMIDKQSFSISFPKLRKLELSLLQVVKLKFGLTDIPPLKRLETLNLPGLSRRDVSELPKTLSVFKLYHSAIEEIEGLEGLEALKRLDISNCKIQNLSGIGQITSLRSLILSDCDDLSLPDLSNLKSLKVLEIRRCKMIGQIEGLENLTSLEKLNISECPAEKSVQVQEALKRVMARSPDT